MSDTTINVNNTGESSSTTVNVSSSTTLQATQTNSGTVTNATDITANTGHNTITDNTAVQGSATGNVAIAFDDSNEINTGVSSSFALPSGGSDSFSSSVSNTGAGSSVSVSHTNSSSLSSTATSSGSVSSTLSINADTGHNTISGNTTFQGGVGGSISINLNDHVAINSATPENPVTGVGGDTPGSSSNNPGLSFTGVGGDFLPLPGLETARTVLADQPRYFAAGGDSLFAQSGVLILISILAVFGKKLLRFLTKSVQGGVVLALCMLLVGGVGIVPTYAADGTNVTAVGPQGPIGPQGPVGPQGPIGPQGPTGPQPVSGTSPQTVDTTTTVNGTGANSTVDTSTTTTTTSTSTTDNTATFSTTIDANLNNGNNSSIRNTNGGGIVTDDINASFTVVNVGNSVLAAGSSIGSQSLNAGSANTVTLNNASNRTALPSQTSVSNTGEGSSTSATLQGTSTTNATTNNTAAATTTVGLVMNTGGDTALQDTNLPGGIQTGDINAAVNVLNLMNVVMPSTQLNIDTWSLVTSPTTTIDLSNTGANSSATVSSTNNTTQNIQVTNVGTATNGMDIHADTGHNEVSETTNSAGIQPGTVDVSGKVVNVINAMPSIYLVNVFGDWNGSLQGLPANSVVIMNTGANSTTDVNATNTNTTNETLNNTANVVNTLHADLTTGGNSIRQTTNAGAIKTGNIVLRANFLNILNSFRTDLSSLHIGILNIFGSNPAATGVGGGTTAPIDSTTVTSGNAPQEVDLNLTPTSQGTAVEMSTKPRTSGVLAALAYIPQNQPSSEVAATTSSDSNPVQLARADFAAPRNLEEVLQPVPEASPKKHFPLGIVLLGLVVSLWLGLELLANAEKHRA